MENDKKTTNEDIKKGIMGAIFDFQKRAKTEKARKEYFKKRGKQWKKR